MNNLTPLNGSKTHPLCEHALGILKSLLNGPIPNYKINPGVINRLLREDLIEIVWIEKASYNNKYKEKQKVRVANSQITQKGKLLTHEQKVL